MFVRERQHVPQQFAEHSTVDRRLGIAVRVEVGGTELIEERLELFQLADGMGALIRGGAAPGDHIARQLAVPVNVVAQFIALRDGQVLSHLWIFAANGFA